MKTKTIFLLLTSLLVSTGCYGYGPLKGKIADAETGEPIEGAVAMAEWTRTKGLGNTYTVSVKVSEAVSDREGNFELKGCYSPFVNEPSLTIYKKGYVAWNNELIFPDLKAREGFEWKSGQMFEVEKFKKEYSHDEHLDFISISIKSSMNLESKKMIYNSFSWEVGPAHNERDSMKKKNIRKNTQ